MESGSGKAHPEARRPEASVLGWHSFVHWCLGVRTFSNLLRGIRARGLPGVCHALGMLGFTYANGVAAFSPRLALWRLPWVRERSRNNLNEVVAVSMRGRREDEMAVTGLRLRLLMDRNPG